MVAPVKAEVGSKAWDPSITGGVGGWTPNPIIPDQGTDWGAWRLLWREKWGFVWGVLERGLPALWTGPGRKVMGWGVRWADGGWS